ncbi:flagellar biosynthetic protein FlhB [Alkalidesulfovibrio alkalitolerans DSM 16529]|uniref:Flagellar biosynthetic protein FlhB n=1 Tax=Alkalidesulfovibrio alkalitolerans DSM 16529 TaxID=1121439 RepID=S7TBV5_9BACT|nr:flagellar biosynthesis protein FlhB [Alkalidesulfovibrio alkalitolerans]EPR34647.1 flagellar biosynthetic protein FlhB [Alkalidesulfovibrio alkalitolerans DSM 16529]
MAQSDPSKTELPTERRIKKAREKGSVAKSQDFTKSVVLLLGTIAVYFLTGHIATQIKSIFIWFFQDGLTSFEATPAGIYDLFVMIATRLAIILLPVFAVLALTCFVVLRVQVGPLWAPKVFEFNFKIFDVAKGLQRIFLSPKTFINLGKSLLQACAVAVAPYLVLKAEAGNLLPLFYASPLEIATYILHLMFLMFSYALVAMIIIGALDLVYQRWDYTEQLKMTKHEVKDERRQAEGDPKVKQKQRQKMLETIAKRMMEAVPKADVVITNPTHYAVALQYDPLTAPAPIVVAKGLDHLALKIKDVAREHNVPIRENKPLARALYKQVEVGDMIPEEMYQAVAAILAQIKRTSSNGPIVS